MSVIDTTLQRVIGSFGSASAGPTLIVMTGMHGNEPAGGLACERLARRLDAEPIDLKGRFVALRGNLKALAQRTRYLDRDFNRSWTKERVARALAHKEKEPFAEADELREVHATIASIVAEANGPVYFLDLHTTSAAGPRS